MDFKKWFKNWLVTAISKGHGVECVKTNAKKDCRHKRDTKYIFYYIQYQSVYLSFKKYFLLCIIYVIHACLCLMYQHCLMFKNCLTPNHLKWTLSHIDLSFADLEVISYPTYKSISLSVFAVCISWTNIPCGPDGCELTNQPRQ